MQNTAESDLCQCNKHFQIENVKTILIISYYKFRNKFDLIFCMIRWFSHTKKREIIVLLMPIITRRWCSHLNDWTWIECMIALNGNTVYLMVFQFFCCFILNLFLSYLIFPIVRSWFEFSLYEFIFVKYCSLFIS